MRENLSPEEKLLRLIRGEKKEKPGESALAPVAVTKKQPYRLSRLKFGVKNSIYDLARRYLVPANTRKIIPVLLALSLAYLAASLVYPWFFLKRIKLPAVSKEEISETAILPKEDTKPYEFYLEGVRSRQIFKSPSALGPDSATLAAEAQSIKDINLVGIISGENPQAIIEDKKSQKTYYVSKGQFIGEFRVEDIREGKIILNYKGQRYELSI